MKKLIYIFLIITSYHTKAQKQTQVEKIDSLLTFLNANNKFMGALAMQEKDKLIFDKAYGFTNSEEKTNADTSTKYKIGSITKTFTAVMIMQLIEEKKLSLDTKLSKFYAKIPNADKITIQMLLHHRTGINDYINNDTVTLKNIYRFHQREEMIQKISEYKPLFEPDSKYDYSNSNYNLLGYILEDITKKSYAENLKLRIVKKLNLKNTELSENINPVKNEAFSYIFDGKKWVKIPEWNNSIAFAAGAISSTASDLTKFFYGLFNGKLLNKVSLDQMKTLKDSYGKALLVFPFYEKKFYGHTGGIENFKTVAAYNIEDDITIALIVNGDNFNRNDIMIGILNLYYQKDYNFPNLKNYYISEDQLKKYEGIYSSKTIPLKITVRVEKGALTAQASNQSSFPLTSISNTEFTYDTAGIKMIFKENEFILKQSGMEFLFTKNQNE